MSELDASSEGKHCMDTMPPLRRSRPARRATAGRNGAVGVVVLGRTREEKRRKIRKRSQSTERHPSRYMLSKPLKKGQKKVEFFFKKTKNYCLYTEERNKRIKNTSKHLPELSYISSFAETNTVSPTPISQEKLEKRFGQSPVFVASTLREDGGIPNEVSSTSLLKEAIHVISCGYEDKTEWGKEVNKAVQSSALHYFDLCVLELPF